MQYVYICNAISEKLNNELGQSVAGNKFSLNMAKALDTHCDGRLTFISTAMIRPEAAEKYGGEIWPGKKMQFAARGKRFFFSELKLRKNIIRILSQIQKAHPDEKITALLENAPFAAATACVACKKRMDISCYSVTIDTPFAGSFRETGIRGHINGWMFRRGVKALRHFDGLISFTEDVKDELKADLPFCPLAIGCLSSKIPEKLPELTTEKAAVYAGTLIYYNGIRELPEAFRILGTEYILHIYGYGPMEEEVRQAAREHENIVFHGRFAPEETERVLSQYELLINPRHIDPGIENFTFPSKLVDYVLTGKSVLTSDFKTLPAAYRDFVYIIREMKPEAIAHAVKEVFADTREDRSRRAKAGVRYIKENQTYDKIAGTILEFSER